MHLRRRDHGEVVGLPRADVVPLPNDRHDLLGHGVHIFSVSHLEAGAAHEIHLQNAVHHHRVRHGNHIIEVIAVR